jgi:hypothetical protein
MPVTIEDVKYSVDYKGIMYKATVVEQTRACMLRVADFGVLPRGKDAALHEFIRRINEVKAATETAIAATESASTNFGVIVIRLP